MERDSSQSGGTVDLPEGREPPSSRWQWFLRTLGLSQVIMAWLEIVLIAGSILILGRLGLVGIRRNLGKPVFHVWLAERFLALPALIGLAFGIGRGLIGLRARAVVCQMIVSSVAAFWALHTVFSDWIDLQDSVELLDEFPVTEWSNVVYYLMKFGSGLVHAAVAILLFRLWHRTSLRDGPEAPDLLPDRRRGFVLASGAAIPLAFGTVGAAHWLLVQLHKFMQLRGIPV